MFVRDVPSPRQTHNAPRTHAPQPNDDKTTTARKIHVHTQEFKHYYFTPILPLKLLCNQDSFLLLVFCHTDICHISATAFLGPLFDTIHEFFPSHLR